jgi:hypothetical protein
LLAVGEALQLPEPNRQRERERPEPNRQRERERERERERADALHATCTWAAADVTCLIPSAVLQVPAAHQRQGTPKVAAVPGQQGAAAGDRLTAHHAAAAGHHRFAAGAWQCADRVCFEWGCVV